MISYHWVAKDKNNKIYLFEKKPCKDKEFGVWWAKAGEEVFDLEMYPVPLQTFMLISNFMRRIENWEDSLTNIDPKDWKIKSI